MRPSTELHKLTLNDPLDPGAAVVVSADVRRIDTPEWEARSMGQVRPDGFFEDGEVTVTLEDGRSAPARSTLVQQGEGPVEVFFTGLGPFTTTG